MGPGPGELWDRDRSWEPLVAISSCQGHWPSEGRMGRTFKGIAYRPCQGSESPLAPGQLSTLPALGTFGPQNSPDWGCLVCDRTLPLPCQSCSPSHCDNHRCLLTGLSWPGNIVSHSKVLQVAGNCYTARSLHLHHQHCMFCFGRSRWDVLEYGFNIWIPGSFIRLLFTKHSSFVDVGVVE